MRPWIPLLLAVLPVACPAAAQDRYVPLEHRLDPARLADVGLTPDQLQQLNGLLRDAQAHAPVAVDAPPPTARATPPAAAPMFIGLDDGPIKAHATGSISGWQPGTLFTLDNGQQWQVLKGEMTLRRALQDPPIEVVPGIAGRWFLQVDPDLPKARVFRVR
ncbi:hypothetical protein EDF77_2154 [Stenotrophomonas maltophilia]|uniref:hypothetical protein n=1 Tax=Stenotrophomonas chelatiphaga TaxID=517011 RepID=UPI000F4B273C|nr:hypothetical protein [Stenotrophomonas chelatiphaga]MCS4231727.1 hypothetical protein [Stenotrophomonas chelatiphaga]ROQ41650.1 hypothetical protein EDF77_2154 [Stenotrophomonas maltophilia]